MNYAYYPGCSLKDSSNAYEESLLAVLETLGVGLDELDDWNCCGATAYSAVDQMKAFAMAARNLALAEGTAHGTAPVDLVAPCAGCYMTLLKTQRYLKEHRSVADTIEGALEAAGLHYGGQVRVRHPLDLLVNDIGLERVAGCRHPAAGRAQGRLLLRLPAGAPVRDVRRPAQPDVAGSPDGSAGSRADRLADEDPLLRRFLLWRPARRDDPRSWSASDLGPAAGGAATRRRRAS